MKSFKAVIDIIGINPFVFVPEDVLACIFLQAGKNKGAIPIKGTINGHPFMQTLVRYSNAWRLYINGPMLHGKKVGDEVTMTLAYDEVERVVPMHPQLKKALKENKEAKAVYDKLSPSLQKEIKRYINNLKTATAVDKNVEKAIRFLTGKERFIGRNGLG